MLTITIPSVEQWDEKENIFVYSKERTLQLEHSLVSLSKWESHWRKVFFSKQEKTFKETLDYIKCMTITQNVDPKIYDDLSKENHDQIKEYIETKFTASFFPENKIDKGHSSEQVTSELIYYWMITLNIPFSCEKWHLSRLFSLIQICNIKNQPKKKRGSGEIISRNAALNAARRQQFNSKG